MKHIVFMLGSYYPNYSAVGKCMGNIADVMAKTNQVTIIGTQTQLEQLSIQDYNNQRIIRITTKAEKRRLKVDYLVKETIGVQRYIAYILQWCLRLVKMLKVLAAPTTFDRKLTEAYYTALKQIPDPIDVIIPTCIPFESVVAALKYKDIHADVVLLPCLYDLFAANRNLNRTSWNLRLKWANNLQIERAMFEESQHVFHVANWTSHIEENHPGYSEKHTEIEHPLLVCPTGQPPCETSPEIHLVYTGVVDEKNRNPLAVLQILAQIKHPELVCDFYSFGAGQSIVEEFALEYPMIIAHGRVESKIAERARAQANILISIGNKDTSQIPSKLIEYMATGKPIIHFAWNSQDTAVELLDNYPVKKIVYLNSSPLKEEIESFILTHKNMIIPFEEVRKWIPEMLPKEEVSNDEQLSGNKYELVFAGALRKNYVEPDYVLDLFGRKPLCDLCNVSFYSAGTGVETVQNSGRSNIYLNGWVSKSELDKVYADANVFVSIAEKTGTQMSSKIFDYMSYGKPVIHIYFSLDDVNLKYLEKYPNALCLLADESKLAEQRVLIQMFLQGRVGQQICTNDLDEMLQSCTPTCVSEAIMNKIKESRKEVRNGTSKFERVS